MTSFERDLAGVVNSHSKESECDMPDFIIGRYLAGCYEALATANLENRHQQQTQVPSAAFEPPRTL